MRRAYVSRRTSACTRQKSGSLVRSLAKRSCLARRRNFLSARTTSSCRTAIIRPCPLGLFGTRTLWSRRISSARAVGCHLATGVELGFGPTPRSTLLVYARSKKRIPWASCCLRVVRLVYRELQLLLPFAQAESETSLFQSLVEEGDELVHLTLQPESLGCDHFQACLFTRHSCISS